MTPVASGLHLHDEADAGNTKQVILSVKGRHARVPCVGDFPRVLERQKADIGVLTTMQDPSPRMRTEAAGVAPITA